VPDRGLRPGPLLGDGSAWHWLWRSLATPIEIIIFFGSWPYASIARPERLIHPAGAGGRPPRPARDSRIRLGGTPTRLPWMSARHPQRADLGAPRRWPIRAVDPVENLAPDYGTCAKSTAVAARFQPPRIFQVLSHACALERLAFRISGANKQ